MPTEEKVTEEQAEQALRQLTLNADDSGTDTEVSEPSATEQQPVETDTADTPDESSVDALPEEATQVDDLDSLRHRTEELEAQIKADSERFNARIQALKERNQANEQILRDRYLRKSTTADRALQILRQTRTDEGISEAEVDRAIREIEGTMNPQSASYAPPEPSSAAASENQALVVNSFLNEQGMTIEEADEFGRWVRSEASSKMSPTEQAVANESLDGFLRLAHARWQQGIREQEQQSKRSDAVGAVKSVQRTQRQAAKAAAASPSAPRKQLSESPAGTMDVSKLTKNDVAALVRQSVEQYK